MRKCRLAGFLVASFLLLVAPQLLKAQEIPYEFESPELIVAIGDVHGDYDGFVDNLMATGLVDKDLRWTGGSAHLVQIGDVVDRGPESRKAMDLLMELERQAEAAGGRVHALLGNHEFWNAVGELNYVSEEEVKAFDGPRDEILREEQRAEAPAPGYFALREAFGPEGDYGKWIRSHNAAVKIGDVVFVHGGITKETVQLGLGEINRRARAEMDSDTWLEGIAVSQDGVLMTRRFSTDDFRREDDERLGLELQEVLNTLEAETMVMGHTVTYGLIEPRFDGRAVLIDAGMLDDYRGGHQAALLIENGRFYAVYRNGKVAIPRSLEGEEGAGYVEAAVKLAPKADSLKQKLASVRLRQGRAREAAELYEDVGVFDHKRRMPYSWRREAAQCFELLGDERKAKALNLMYLTAFGTFIDRLGPFGINHQHRFARECLRLGLLREEALRAASNAAHAYPKTESFKVTLAWAILQNADPKRAVRVLNGVIRRGGDGFEPQLRLGKAYAELQQDEKALEAFQAALGYEPGNAEVQRAIAELKE